MTEDNYLEQIDLYARQFGKRYLANQQRYTLDPPTQSNSPSNSSEPEPTSSQPAETSSSSPTGQGSIHESIEHLSRMTPAELNPKSMYPGPLTGLMESQKMWPDGYPRHRSGVAFDRRLPRTEIRELLQSSTKNSSGSQPLGRESVIPSSPRYSSRLDIESQFHDPSQDMTQRLDTPMDTTTPPSGTSDPSDSIPTTSDQPASTPVAADHTAVQAQQATAAAMASVQAMTQTIQAMTHAIGQAMTPPVRPNRAMRRRMGKKQTNNVPRVR